MADFQTGSPREYPQLPAVILAMLPALEASPEYQRLSEDDQELPTVVCGAFGRYLNRLLSENQGADTANIDASFHVIERLATSPDPEVQNTLVVEVFEHLDLTEDETERFRRRLGPAARKLHGRWMGP